MEKIQEIAEGILSHRKKYFELLWLFHTQGINDGIEESREHLRRYIGDERKLEVLNNYISNDKTEEYLLMNMKSLIENNLVIGTSPKLINFESRLTNSIQLRYNNALRVNDINSININEIMEKLSVEVCNMERKEIYLSLLKLNDLVLESGFYKLIVLRKKIAESRQTSYIDLMYHKRGCNKIDIFKMVDVVKSKKDYYRAIEKEIANKYLNKDVIMPWNMAYLSKKIRPNIVLENVNDNFVSILESMLELIGIDLNSLNITFDLFQRERKAKSPFFFNIMPGMDYRILLNINNNFTDLGGALHEIGHALYISLSYSYENSIKNVFENDIISEAIAIFLGWLLYAEMYKNVPGLEKIGNYNFSDYKKLRLIKRFKAIRDLEFENNIYELDDYSNEAISKLYTKLSREILGEDMEDILFPWALNFQIIGKPINQHNYIIGEILADQILAAYCKCYNVDDISKKPEKLYEFLKGILNKGNSKICLKEFYDSIDIK